jgi:hypothetical protein
MGKNQAFLESTSHMTNCSSSTTRRSGVALWDQKTLSRRYGHRFTLLDPSEYWDHYQTPGTSQKLSAAPWDPPWIHGISVLCGKWEKSLRSDFRIPTVSALIFSSVTIIILNIKWRINITHFRGIYSLSLAAYWQNKRNCSPKLKWSISKSSRLSWSIDNYRELPHSLGEQWIHTNCKILYSVTSFDPFVSGQLFFGCFFCGLLESEGFHLNLLQKL